MTTYLPCALAALLVIIEARRVITGHLRRGRWRRILGESETVTVQQPDVFIYNVGMRVHSRWVANWMSKPPTHVIVKVDYRTGRLWLWDSTPYRRAT